MDGPSLSNKEPHKIPAKLGTQSYTLLTNHFTVTDISVSTLYQDKVI